MSWLGSEEGKRKASAPGFSLVRTKLTFDLSIPDLVIGLIIGCGYDKLKTITPLFVILYGLMVRRKTKRKRKREEDAFRRVES